MTHIVAGGIAGVVESSCCHPLDTIKTRMQLRTQGGSTKGPIATASRIVSNEGFFALYKGLSAVMAGIVPKMAVRFTSFEAYKNWLGATPYGSKGGCPIRHFFTPVKNTNSNRRRHIDSININNSVVRHQPQRQHFSCTLSRLLSWPFSLGPSLLVLLSMPAMNYIS